MDKITQLSKKQIPFLFIISYDKNQVFAQPIKELDKDIFFKIEKYRNYPKIKRDKEFYLNKYPIEFEIYKDKLDRVIREIQKGNTYLLNLTFKTPIETNLSLKEIFTYSRAKYKLYFKDKFICFSPEKFIEIEGNTISTYPMKGTIEANIPNAKEKILQNQKEMAEHIMIVDLMRNDLGMVGKDIRVERFRYIDKIRAGDKELLQVSSKITAKLPKNWRDNLGEILQTLLPAGSISGTPKKKTIEIIEEIENYKRDFYTGIFGIFDGDNLYSGVMIRFIEKEANRLFYKSGGGITIDSNAKSEYKELIDKIYLPL
jgi:para-aminobenzoate synthetase component 1